ncbi:MAG: RelA/SpoT family protein [Patescibacteria group bacterium]|nr:RelA/SpoT family protein [Patescibacteria group bacterium]
MTIEKLIQENKQNNPNADIKLIKKAFYFAKKAHQGQKRESGEDYIIHLLYTAFYLTKLNLNSTTIASGLLHDVLEDTKISEQELKKEFGKEILFLVQGVTKLNKIKYRGTKRYVENLKKMFFATAKDIRVILIKLCDRLHNAQTLRYLAPEKAKKMAIETLEIYSPIAMRLGIGELSGRLQDSAFPFAYPEEYKKLISQVKDKYEKRKKYLKKIKPIIQKKLRKKQISIIEIDYRSKRYWSLYNKLQRYDNDLDKIYDLVALRIIVKDIEECYKTMGIIHKLWRPIPGKIKDYIAMPKTNKYRSLHTTVFCVNGKITEFQIRTPQMHEEAERGIAAHWYYSEQKGLKAHLKKLISKAPEKEIQWVKELGKYKEKSKDINFDNYLKSLKIDFFKKRIFVFTPKGDVMNLPENACCVDFAFATHTEIGEQCEQAKVNGKIAPLSRCLKNGDIVKIITNKNKKPSRDWLKFVKTNLARAKIKNYFKDETAISKKNIISPIVKKTRPLILPYKKTIKALTIKSLNATQSKKALKVSVAGQTGIKVNFGKCCSPEHKNKIMAYITQNKGATIHKANCKNLKTSQKKYPEKILKAKWEK